MHGVSPRQSGDLDTLWWDSFDTQAIHAATWSSLAKMPARTHYSAPLWVLALASLLLLAAAEYSSKDDIVILTDKNFEREVLKSADYWLVEFYAPWCVHAVCRLLLYMTTRRWVLITG